jgi:hypothetical protein
LSDDAFNGSDGKGIAAILKAEIAKGKYDLILTGAQADDGAAQVGGILAAMSRAILPRSTEFLPINVTVVMGMSFSSHSLASKLNAVEDSSQQSDYHCRTARNPSFT